MLDGDEFSRRLKLKIELDEKRRKLISSVLPQLNSLGNAVIRVDNLPRKLTVHTFNLMMGTYSISDKNTVGVVSGNKNGEEMMNLMIVLDSSNIDIERVLSMNGYVTFYGTKLSCKKTNKEELESFLKKNHDKIIRLKIDDKLPINNIGYGNN